MHDALPLGGKIKGLRRRDKLTQAELAKRLGISSSYLNLIESNKRPLTAALLLKLASQFRVELSAFASETDARLSSEVAEVFADPIFAARELTEREARELCGESPTVARALVDLYGAFVRARDNGQALASRLSEEGAATTPAAGLPSEEVGDLIQRHQNHFPTLETLAEQVWAEAALDPDDVYGGLLRYLAERHGMQVRIVKVGDERNAMRRYDPELRLLQISEVLPPRSRRFQIAHQLGLVVASEAMNAILSPAREVTTDEGRALGRVALANYFAAALLMPYAPFLEAAKAERYDVELLAHRFGASFEQVCHRLTTMRRAGQEGVPFHLLRIDMAGNISKRFSASGIRIARFSGACPRWNVHAAFLTPGMIRIQISRMGDGGVYFCIARTIRSDRGGYNVPHTVHAVGMGCPIERARELVYADGVDLDNADAVVPVGVTCRLCDQLDCAQRAFPPLLHPLRVHENVRGVSFYSPVSDAG